MGSHLLPSAHHRLEQRLCHEVADGNRHHSADLLQHAVQSGQDGPGGVVAGASVVQILMPTRAAATKKRSGCERRTVARTA
eukprot:3597475-Pyramimonas_sp.AAC.1